MRQPALGRNRQDRSKRALRALREGFPTFFTVDQATQGLDRTGEKDVLLVGEARGREWLGN